MRKKWYVLFVLALFVVQVSFLAAQTTPSKAVAKLLEKAEKALKSNELDKALESYNKALEQAPEYGPIYYGIGRVQVAQKKMDEALPNLEKAIQLSPEMVEFKQYFAKTLFSGARELLGQQVVNKAIEYFVKITAISGINTVEPKLYVESLYQVGNLYSAQQEFGKSIEYFQKLLDTPDIATTDARLVFFVNYQTGINYYQMQKNVESNTFLEKAIGMANAESYNGKAFATAHYLIGLNASQTKEYAKSNQHLTKFLELNKVEANANPQLDPLSHFILGSNQMAELDEKVQKIRDDANEKLDKKKEIETLAKQYPDIETYLSKAIELKSDLEPAYMNLGNFYYYLGNNEKTISTYKTLIEKFPGSPDIEMYKKFLANLEKPAETKPEPKKKK